MQLVAEPAHSLHNELHSVNETYSTLTLIIIAELSRGAFRDASRPTFKRKIAKWVTASAVVSSTGTCKTQLVTGCVKENNTFAVRVD